MTLRRAWEGYCRQFGIGSVNEVDAWDFFMTQFDEMLREDIEKIEHYPDDSTVYAKSILEARRLSIKK